jgi:hypothetical protein
MNKKNAKNVQKFAIAAYLKLTKTRGMRKNKSHVLSYLDWSLL